jgi:tetratricopeptide (TPR) repeat protein
LVELGQKDQLIGRLEKLHAADPDNVPLAYFLAQQYREAGQFDKAEPTYRSLIERHKKRPPLEAYQGLVDVYRQQKDTAKLLATVGEAAVLTNSLAPLGESGKALVADAERSKAIVELARTELAADPARVNFGSRLAAALLAVELEDYAAADGLFAAALEAAGPKTAETLSTWALELLMANQYAEAAKVFQRGLKEKLIPDDNPTYHYYLSGALEMSGQTDSALEHARRAAELKKDSPRFRSRMAWILYHAKRYDVARQSYQALVEEFDKNRESPEVREVMRDARLVLSNLAVIEQELPESEEWLEQVLDEFPEDVGAQNDLGYLWADAGKHLDIAHRMIQVAVSAEPKNTAYRDSLGWVLFRLGRYPEAVAELRAAAAAAPEEPDPTILDHLAEALLKAGDQAGAAEQWNRAAELFEKHAEPDKARAVREKVSKVQAATPAEK